MSEAATSIEDSLALRAIAAVPSWAGKPIDYRLVSAPVMSPMHRGIDSLCFALDVDGEPLFLKIVHPELQEEVDVASSFVAAETAAKAGVAPPAHICLPDERAIVFERLGLDWRTARMDDLARVDVMAGVIAAKKALHANAPLPRDWSVFDRIRSLAVKPEALAPFESADAAQTVDAAARIEMAISASGIDSKPCHNDGLASNIMIGADGAVRLVDFDLAANNDPHYDIGILLNEAFVFETEMMPAIEAYEGSFRRQTLDRCRLYAIADDLYWALWAGRMATVSRRSTIEFLKYAQWRFLRCRMALQDSEFERRLGAI